MSGRDPVHRYEAEVVWSGSTGVGYASYGRNHTARAAPAPVPLTLSSDPAFRGDPEMLNPEQLVVLAAASCQLLSFHAVAARARVDVVGYRDEARAEMPVDDRPVRITRFDLAPRIVLRAAADTPELRARVARLVDVAHRECYIANSLRTEITVQATVVVLPADRT